MPNIFDIYVNGYRAYGEILSEGLRDTAEWADQYLGERNTNLVVNATIIDRGVDAVVSLIVRRSPQAAAAAKFAPYIKEFLKAGFAMTARGKSFYAAATDRVASRSFDVLAKAVDGDAYSSFAPELRAIIKRSIMEIVPE